MPSPLNNLDAVFRDATVPILIEDLAGRVVDLNDEAVKTYGYTRDELVGHPIKEIVPPERHGQADDLLRRCRAGESVQGIEGLRVTKNGRQIPVLLSLSLLSNDAGEPEAIATFAKDITSLHQAEAELKSLNRNLEAKVQERTSKLAAAEERSRLLLESTPDAMVIVDAQGSIQAVNVETERLLGYRREDLIGQPVEMLVPEKYREEHIAKRNAAISNPNHPAMATGRELVARREDGTLVPVEIALSRLETDEGLLVLAAVRDVTERKRAQDELRESEQRSRLLLEAAGEGIFGTDTGGRVTFANPATLRMLGYEAEEFLAQNVHHLIHHSHKDGSPYPVEQCPMYHAFTRGEYGNVDDEVLWRKDGSRFSVHYMSTPIRKDGELVGSVITFSDITRRRKAEEESRRVNFLSDIALELTHCAYWHVDYSDPDYYYQSERAARILGEPVKPDGRYHLQREWYDRLVEANPETAEKTSERYQGAIDGRYENYESTYAYKRPIDGEIVWVHALGKVVRDDDGKIQHMYGVYQDISARVEAEQTLKAAKDRLTHELAVARELSDAADREHKLWLEGTSIAVRALRESIEACAGSEDPVLLTGPDGAGQEAVARAIHRSSPRAGRPFIYVACPHVSGADDTAFGFCSANTDQPAIGKMALADGGTLYLEGIEALGRTAQEGLLKVLHEAAGLRAAGEMPSPDVRIISYASGDLADPVRQGNFNAMLAQILGARRLAVPSLAERRDDVVSLANSIVAARARSLGKALDGLSSQSEEMLARYSWPGNLGELQSVVARAVVLAMGTRVEIPEDLLQEGRRVGGYTLERQLGSGGMGEVWLARHSLLARPSAVKLIRQQAMQEDSGAREMLEERFRREAQATSQLRSPHTVELYDFGVTEDGDFYYVMEYLSGVDLESLVTKYGPLSPARAVHFLSQACMSLGEAHQAGLVHRDVKPANLFACRLGPHFDFLKLLDFGIVKKTGGPDQTATVAGQLKGTPASLSPEVVQGEQAGLESDIYALGCVAYRLLTGKHVFEAPTVMATLIQHVSQPPKPLSEHRSDLPGQLDQLVLGCLAKNPADRPSSAFELRERLMSIPLEESWDQRRAEAWWKENVPDIDDNASTKSVSETMVWGRGDTE